MTQKIRSLPRICMLVALAGAGMPDVALTQQQPALRVLTDSTVVQELRLRDGTKLVGHVLSINASQIAFRTVGGIDLDLLRGDIVGVREIAGFRHQGEFWVHDPMDSRLFIFPTARVPEHGRGYFGVYELFVPSVGFGIGGIGMLSAGMSLFPGVSIDEQVFYIAPKLQLFDVEHAQGSVGATWVRPGAEDEGAGFAFGVLTAGTRIASITGGIGVPLVRDQEFDRSTVFILGGELRVARSINLVSENWIFPNDEVAFGLGLRVLAGAVSVEVAGVTATDADLVLPLVNVSFTW